VGPIPKPKNTGLSQVLEIRSAVSNCVWPLVISSKTPRVMKMLNLPPSMGTTETPKRPRSF